ncbi:acyl-CoA dehydrogenase family protein [Nocardia camponoti]|uniref:Acyl-CoA dehydrogenase FadE28 n=1 Tax=Nocardia camponoti TaxID=1616106 RepID=A0A917VBI8_9NOCA|nr:acyl-CoA dehydrogenase family protein [Nocardia camponoti]GGK59950.1 acyl-CoA dehydrogenase FadE28 [Nocardia camponoti]
MDFTRDESADAVAEVVVSLLERTAARDMDLWPALVDSGLLAVAVPEKFGGDGMGLPEVSALVMELARDAVCVPALTTLALGVLPLVNAALPDDIAERVFTDVINGAIVTAALHEPGAPFTATPTTLATAHPAEHADVAPPNSASPRSGSSVIAESVGPVASGTPHGQGTAAGSSSASQVAMVGITGRKVAVPYANEAKWLLIPTNAGVALVDSTADGLRIIPSPSSSGTPEATVVLDNVAATHLIPDLLPTLHHTALAAMGAAADGLLTGALSLTAEHVRTRRQFDRPLAEFQAVAQQVADLYVVSRTLHVAAEAACWCNATAEDLDIVAYWAADQLPRAMQRCHHLHGGLGVDICHPMHRYYSQAKDLARQLGGADLRLDLLGARCSLS